MRPILGACFACTKTAPLWPSCRAQFRCCAGIAANTMTILWQVLFWLCSCVIVYVYAGYPILIQCLARIMGKNVARSPIQPTVTVVIAAYNEAAGIRAKLDNVSTGQRWQIKAYKQVEIHLTPNGDHRSPNRSSIGRAEQGISPNVFVRTSKLEAPTAIGAITQRATIRVRTTHVLRVAWAFN